MKEQIVEQRILTADDGKFLTDGKTYGQTIVLPVDADFTEWQEVSEEELPKEETTAEPKGETA